MAAVSKGAAATQELCEPALLGELQILRRGSAVATGCELVFDLLSLGKRRNAGTLQRRNVYEYVFPTIFGLDESKSLGRVEPLYGSSSHDSYL